MSVVADACVAKLGFTLTVQIFNPLVVCINALLYSVKCLLDTLIVLVKVVLDASFGKCSSVLASLVFT